MSTNPINFLDQVEHRIDDAERFRESGERLVVVTLPIPALAYGISCISAALMVVIDLCEAFLAKRQASKNADEFIH